MPSDRLVRAALDHPKVGRLLIVNAPRSAPAMMLRWLAGRREDKLDDYPNATVKTPLRLRREWPTDVAEVEKECARYARFVLNQVEENDLEEPALVTMNPLIAGFARFPWPTTYFAVDDWAAHPRFERLHDVVEAAYSGIRLREISTAAVSEPLLQRLSPTGPRLVVPNGIAAPEWLEIGPTPDWLDEIPRPRAIYVGTLDDRMDTDVVAAAADARPSVSFVLVGPGGQDPSYAALSERANVFIHPPVLRAEVTRTVAACDVGIVPHRRTTLTESMSPLKVYEYLAGGLPVAAVDIKPMRGIDPRVVLVEPGDYVAGLDRAVAMGRADETSRRAFIASNDWAERHNDMLGLIMPSSSVD